MRFAKSAELTLALVATRAVLFVYGADAPSGRSVSLLFENDGVWTVSRPVDFSNKYSLFICRNSEKDLALYSFTSP